MKPLASTPSPAIAPAGFSSSAAPGASLRDRSKDAHVPVSVIVAILIGVAIRIVAAIRLPFEQDELYTFAESRDLFHTTLAPGIDSRPLYYLLQHPLLSATPSPFGLRILPLVFGALGLWVTWLAARRFLGATGGVIATVLVATSPWHLYASSMARYYSLVYLCAALVVMLLPDANETDRPAPYFRILAVFVVGTLTHPSFVIAMAGVVGGSLLVRSDARLGLRWPSRNAWRYLWLPYAGFLVLEFVLLRVFGRAHAMANLGARGAAATIRLVPAMVDWMTLPVFIAAALGAILLATRKREERQLGVMAIVSTVATFALLLVASTRTGVYADYGIGILPLAFIAAASLGSAFEQGFGPTVGSLAMLALVVGSSTPSIISYLSDGLRFDYRPAYETIARAHPDGVVLGWPEALRRQYAGGLRGYELRPDSAYLNRIIEREGQVWAVVSAKRYGIVEDDSGQLARWLSDNCRLDASFSHPRFDYRLYRVDLYRCQRNRG